MTSLFTLSCRRFASAAGGDKPRVFFGLTRQYTLRDRRIKAGPPQPRKVPFHRIGVAPAGTKYFCRDFKNPTLSQSNASFTIEYHPFKQTDMMEATKRALTSVLPGCRVTSLPIEDANEPFRVSRSLDGRVLMERSPTESKQPLVVDDLRDLVNLARKF